MSGGDGVGLGGCGGLRGGGGRAVAIKDSIKDLFKLTLFFLLIFDGGGYLPGEDGCSGRGGAEAAADRDGGGVLVGDGGGDGGEDARNEIFLVYKEAEAKSSRLK